MLSNDVSQRLTANVTRTESATVRSTSLVTAHGASADATGAGHVMQISSLLREAQSQVLELLPHKEENSRLATELALLKDRVRSKEEECRKLQHVLNAERDDRHRVVKSVMEEGGAATSAAEQRTRRLEEQLLEKKSEIGLLQRDLERRNAQCKSAEEDLQHQRQQRHEDAQKASEAATAQLQQQHKAHLAEKTAEEASRERARLEELMKSLVKQLHDSEAQLGAARHDLDQVRRKRNDLSAECAQQQGQLSAMQEKLGDQEKTSAVVTQLRTENAHLLSARDELTETRRLLDSATAANQAERSSRRVIEAERDELRMRLTATASEVELLQTQLHRARCDAAERLSLRAECDETRKALDAAYRSSSDLQATLQEARREVADRSGEVDTFSTTIIKELTVFRTTLETGVNSDEVLAAVTNQSSLLRLHAGSHDTSGTASDTSRSAGRLQPVLWALQPLRRAIVEANRMAEEDRVKLASLSRLLETERANSHALSDDLRAANNQLAQLQLRLAEANGKGEDAQRELRFAQESLQDLGDTSRRRLAALADSLHLEAATAAWDTVFTAAARVAQEAAAQRVELQRLGEVSGDQTRQLLLTKQQVELQRLELEGNASKRMQELVATHLSAINDANEEKAVLREALRHETQRHELTAKDLSASRLNHQAVAHALTTLQLQRDSLLSELEALRKQLDHSHTVAAETQKEKHALTEALQAETYRHSASATQALDLSGELARSKDLAAQLHGVSTALLRGVLWHEARGKTLVRERNFSLQYSRLLEDILSGAVQDRLVAKPKASLRSAAIAILAANRLVRLVSQRPRLGLGVSPRRARANRRALPDIHPISAVQLAAVLSADPSETVQQLQVLAELNTAQQGAKDTNFALFWKLCSRAKLCGFPVLAKATLAALRKLHGDAAEARTAIRRLESECDGLRSVIHGKEDDIQDCTAKLARSLAERTQLVEKRHVDHLQHELVQARSHLARERDEKRSAEEAAQHLRVREMNLLAAQSELQNEARSLAIELAQRTASVDAVSALRGRPAYTPGPHSAPNTNGSSFMSDASFTAQPTPVRRDVPALLGASSGKQLRSALAPQERSRSQNSVRSPIDADDFRASGQTATTDLFKMISEIDSRINDALRQH